MAQNADNTSPKLFNLKFQGGSAGDYVAAIGKAAGALNVFVAPEAAQVPMPPIELQSVTVPSALGVLHGRTYTEARRAITLLYNEGGTMAQSEQPIYSISAKVSGAPNISALHNRIWSIAGLQTHQVSADDMLTAIQAALDLIGKDQTPAQLRLHEATGILIARGTEDQLETIGDVLDQLEKSAALKHAAQTAAAAPDAETSELKKQLNEQAKIIDDLRAQIAQLLRQAREKQNN